MVVAAPCRVIYGDTDAMGIVYYANYFRYFELGRNEYLRARGLTYREVEAAGLALPVAEARCRYRKPARYDDLITVETRVVRARGARVVFAYTVRGDEGAVLVEGETEHGVVGAGGRPTRLPAELLAALAPEEA